MQRNEAVRAVWEYPRIAGNYAIWGGGAATQFLRKALLRRSDAFTATSLLLSELRELRLLMYSSILWRLTLELPFLIHAQQMLRDKFSGIKLLVTVRLTETPYTYEVQSIIPFVHLLAAYLLDIQPVMARGGGGGSSSGGGGGHGGGFSGGGIGGSASGKGGDIGLAASIFFFILAFYLFVGVMRFLQKRQRTMPPQTQTDFSADPLKGRIAETFMAFELGWGSFQVEPLKPYLTSGYYRRIVLELNVLQAMGRQNVMRSPTVQFITVLNGATDTACTAKINAWAEDMLTDTVSDVALYVNREPFEEYWKFVLEDGVWKLDLISQATEAASLVSPEIADFAARNGFFFDPDFGSLMLPQKGAIFSAGTFGSADINNHVIGFYRNKIVEFYTYHPEASNSLTSLSYLVAQVVLPSQYRDILVSRRGFWSRPPRGLVARRLESPDFNKKFALYADPLDQVSSWQLLTPTFMERLTGLEFEINIEVVGNFLYFYTKDAAAQYGQLLEILDWAFNEMK